MLIEKLMIALAVSLLFGTGGSLPAQCQAQHGSDVVDATVLHLS